MPSGKTLLMVFDLQLQGTPLFVRMVPFYETKSQKKQTLLLLVMIGGKSILLKSSSCFGFQTKVGIHNFSCWGDGVLPSCNPTPTFWLFSFIILQLLKYSHVIPPPTFRLLPPMRKQLAMRLPNYNYYLYLITICTNYNYNYNL